MFSQLVSKIYKDFSGGLVVKTPSQCSGAQVQPVKGIIFHMQCDVAKEFLGRLKLASELISCGQNTFV